MIPNISGLILRNPAKAPRGPFGEAASWRRSVHTEGVAPRFPLSGRLLPPSSSESGVGEANPAHVGKQCGWPWAWSHLPGPLCQASFQMPVSAQVRWGLSASYSATPLGFSFGFRVQTGLHSCEEACPASSKLEKSTITQDLSLKFLLVPRGAQALKAAAGCCPGPHAASPSPLPHRDPRLASSAESPPPLP